MLKLLASESAPWSKILHYALWTSPLWVKPDIFILYELQMKLHLACSSRWIKKQQRKQHPKTSKCELEGVAVTQLPKIHTRG